ncbi:MAG: GAK system XXXCH domain-containing protein [Deltaproteobacteria bacterium]|nr:GAK system XXXCH domain-containing protein [Deltaproteobacteria bacterium]
MTDDPEDIRNETLMTPMQAADFLRRLAQQLEAGHLETGGVEVATEGSLKVKQSLRSKGDRVVFKVKLKYEKAAAHPVSATGDPLPPAPAEEGAPEEGGRPSYKKLKKSLASDFKSLKTALDAGQTPAPELCRQVAGQCRQACDYPDKGDDNYPTWRELADRLETAGEAGSLADLQAIHAELRELKSACHKNHK